MSETHESYEINDKRTIKEFKKITFSGFKKSDVKKQLLQALIEGNIETSNFWCAQFICAGHFLDLWDIFLLFTCKHIHYGNPKLPIYLNTRLDSFKNIMNMGYIGNEIKLRNNTKIRNLFAEIVSVLCLSQKKHTFDVIKINEKDYSTVEINYKLKADKLVYAQTIFMEDDPKELFIPLNEFVYSIQENIQNSNDACYWIEWIMGYEKMCKKKKETCNGARRSGFSIDQKFEHDIIWLIWSSILEESKTREKIKEKIIHSLLDLYCIRYSSGVKTRRRFILYFAIMILTETINLHKQIVESGSTNVVHNIVDKIGNIYKQLKKDEVKPETDYLFHGLKKDNTDKTLDKLDMMNNFDFVPRN
jgi:hypothetical protein